MNRTKIPWCDYRWNPITGCSPESEGCANCYAATMAHRFHRPWGEPVFHQELLEQPFKTRKPGRVFVCSTSDIFHEKCDRSWWRKIRVAIASAPQHTYILLTKRPQNIPERIGDWPRNWWLGVTAENQARADERIPILLSIPAAVRFVSVEPMLTPVTLIGYHKRLSWVIAGPETGRKKRPCDDAWIDALAAESPCFFDKRKDGKRREFPMPNGGAELRRGAP